MKKTTKVAPKPKELKPLVELVSYSIKMVIPTGQYANIQPEIIVKSGSIQDAHDFIAPHMNKLWKEYFMVNERRPEPPKVNQAPLPAPVTPAEKIAEDFGGKVIGGGLPAKPVEAVQPPESSVALIKATSAIQSCLSLDALELIESQVIKSVKLSHEDKETLMPLLEKKAIDLTFPDDEKRGN